MSRTIYVTGGRKDYAVGTLRDSNGGDLEAATIRLGVSASRTVVPTTWYAPDVETYPAAGQAVLSLLIDETRAPVGTHWLWADVVDNPTTQPVLAYDKPFVTL